VKHRTRTLRPADHTTRHFGGLNWDLNTHRSTQQLIGWIGTSTRSTQTTSKDRSSRIGTSTRVSTTLFRRRHEPPNIAKNQFLFSPAQRRNYCLLSFFALQRTKGRKHSQSAQHRSTGGPKQQSPTDEAQHCLQKGYDTGGANDVVPRRKGSPASSPKCGTERRPAPLGTPPRCH
jgi:hypothetical protein